MALRVAAPAAVMLALWYSSSQSPQRREPSILRALLHNGAHVVAYAGLAGAWLLTMLPRRRERELLVSRSVITAAVVLSVVYGVVDEVHQSFVPGRVCSLWDIVSDACGSALAVAGLLWSLSGERRFAIRIGVLLLVGAASVAAGTWLPG